MKTHRLHALAITALLAAAACDRVPTAASGPRAVVPEAAGRKLLGTVTCRVDVVAQTQKCGDLVSAGGISQTRVIYGGTYFSLITGVSWHDSGAQRDNMFIKIQNNLGQAIGTHDGIFSDSIRVFVTNYAVTGGTGVVAPYNHKGTGTFTAANQAYWEYRELVDPNGGQSAEQLWQWSVPNTVTSWTYTVAVSAPIAHPNGWVSVTGDEQIQHSHAVDHVATVYDWTGGVVTSGWVTWSRVNVSGNVYLSTTDERTVHVLGVIVGTAEITASFGSATPAVYGVEVY